MENYSTILLKGTEYIITFDMNVMAHIQEVYGTISKWSERVDQKEDFTALRDVLTCMINEGIDIYNEDNEDKKPNVTEKQVGRWINSQNMGSIFNNLMVEMKDSTETEDSKNDTSTKSKKTKE